MDFGGVLREAMSVTLAGFGGLECRCEVTQGGRTVVGIGKLTRDQSWRVF